MTNEEIISSFNENFSRDYFGKATVTDNKLSFTSDVTFRMSSKFTRLPFNFDKVDGNFSVSYSKLTTLEGSPRIVGRGFFCEQTNITNLIGAPEKIQGAFNCKDNYNLRSLQGCTKIIPGSFFCDNTSITNFQGGPQYIGGDLWMTNTSIESFYPAPWAIGGHLYTTWHEDMPLLGILNIKLLQRVEFHDIDASNDDTGPVLSNEDLSDILNRYLGTGTQGMLPCADEMIEAGYGSNAHYD